MVTRQERVSEFSQSVPPNNKSAELLCEDHCGTYVIPFLCERRNGAWYKIGDSRPVDANVIGWRMAGATSKTADLDVWTTQTWME